MNRPRPLADFFYHARRLPGESADPNRPKLPTMVAGWLLLSFASSNVMTSMKTGIILSALIA
jgi:hypothetical protein